MTNAQKIDAFFRLRRQFSEASRQFCVEGAGDELQRLKPNAQEALSRYTGQSPQDKPAEALRARVVQRRFKTRG